jgi:CHASE3 domain sensor protein
MTQSNNKNVCSSHSGLCTTTQFLEKSIQELQHKVEYQRGVLEGQIAATNNSVQDLGNKLRSEMKEAIKEIRDLIEKKETKTNSNKVLIISTIVSPIIVGTILLVVQHFAK